jgi:hypothetical protein
VGWCEQDRPKWYRDVMEKSEGRYSLQQLSEMSLPQLAALEHYRKELSFAEAIKLIQSRKANRGKTG